MGFWGTLVAVRADRAPGVLAEQSATIREPRGDGWNVFEVSSNLLGDGTEALEQLVEASAAPVLGAYFADSDYGQVVGVAPSGLRWGAWLDARTAYLLERDHHVMDGMSKAEARRTARQVIASFGMRPAVAASLAVRWSAEAGYTVSERSIRRLLRTSTGAAELIRAPWKPYLFPEERFSELLTRLGVPRRP